MGKSRQHLSVDLNQADVSSIASYLGERSRTTQLNLTRLSFHDDAALQAMRDLLSSNTTSFSRFCFTFHCEMNGVELFPVSLPTSPLPATLLVWGA